MSDIIKILPDHVANQIAAGEVVQRPASAVKELLENAIDSGATEIELIIKDSGRTLIQVVDNGCGMSETDARLCFERHATSKIRQADDLFSIRTFGFRGEALASIAAVAQVEMKTRRTEDDTATLIVIEGSEVKDQSICSAPVGTSVMVKNLFYNVPARRNFLKTEQTEITYIVEELLRVALVHNDIAFTYYNNGKLVNRYPKSGLRQRINAIFSANYSEKLLPLEEKTHVVSFSGFVGKPEYVRKTRGEQYFFVNKRYIRHPYLAHSVEKAYTELIPDHTYPSYFIYLTMDPSLIDVNIHPTKTEIKFQDEKTIYGLLKAAIRKSFGSYGIVPSIDFEMERAYDFTEKTDDRPLRIPTISVDRDYNPFADKDFMNSGIKHVTDKNTAQWEKLYNVEQNSNTNNESEKKLWDDDRNDVSGALFVMFSKRIFATQVKSGLMFVDVVNARERILFERYLANLQEHPCEGQRLLYPQSIEFSPADAELLTEIMADVKLLGIDVEPFGKNTFVVHSLPADMFEENAAGIIEKLLESYKMQQMELNSDKKTSLAAVVARNLSQKGLRILNPQEMQALVDELFACSIPEMAPSGRKTIFIMPYEEIEKKFR